MCYLKNFRGSCSPLLKAQGCSLPAPHHSGHGNENSKKIRITVSQCFEAWPGHASRRQLSLQLVNNLEYLIRGKTSVSISIFKFFHENVPGGMCDFFPFF